MTPLYDIAIILGLLGLLLAAAILAKKASTAAGSLLLAARRHVRTEAGNVGRQVKRDKAYQPSTHHLTRT